MKTENVKIADLIVAEYNPRKMSVSEMEKLKKGIREFGLVVPIVINKDGTIIGGHQRVTACHELGMNAVPCIRIDVDKKREKILNLALNNIEGENDLPKLRDLLSDLDDGSFDMELTGFDGDELQDLFDGKEKATKIIELDQAVQMKPAREYIVIMCDPNNSEWEEIKTILDLKMVRRGGYQKGSPFDSHGVERVIPAARFLEVLKGEI